MKYNCTCCNYSTDDFGNWAKHKKSKKHIDNSNKENENNKITQNYSKNRKITPSTEHIVNKKSDKQNVNKIIKQTKEDKTTGSEQDNFTCEYCQKNFSRKFNLERHLLSCVNHKHTLLENEFEKYKKEKDMESQLRILEEKLKNMEKEKECLEREKNQMKMYMDTLKSEMEKDKLSMKHHIDTLKTENLYQKQLINSAGGLVQKSMNTLSYLLVHHNKAPQLQSLSDYSIITKDTETLIKDLIFYHKKGKFNKYIGDFIIKQYKKEDPNLQALWSSDIDRLNYFIRELINNKDDILTSDNDLKNTNKKIINWVVDKKGIKVCKFIIDPLLDYISKIGIKYIRDKNEIIEDLDTNEASNVLTNMQEIGIINSGIKNKTISNEINKYIAPFFYLNKDNAIK